MLWHSVFIDLFGAFLNIPPLSVLFYADSGNFCFIALVRLYIHISKKGVIVVKKFSAPEMTFERVSIDAVESVMEYLDFPGEFQCEIVRRAAYQVLSHNTVWEEELEAYKKMAQEYGSIDGRRPKDEDIFAEISYVAHKVSIKLLEEDSAQYAEANISPEAVDSAMAVAQVDCDVNAMRTLLGDYAVGGVAFVEENDDEALRVFAATVDDIVSVAARMPEEL